MRRFRRSARRGTLLVLASSALAVAAAAVSGPDSPLAGTSVLTQASYSDPAGDATNGAPDLTTYRVSDSGGAITWVVTAPGLPATETYVEIHVDTDKNPSTGSAAPYRVHGSEYSLILDGENLARNWWRWDGSRSPPDWTLLSASAMTSSYQNGVWTATVRAADMGNLRTFNFRVFTWKFRDDRVYGQDETATSEYTLGQRPPPPPTPTPTPTPTPSNRVAITKLARTPSKPTAGESFTVSATVARVGRAGKFNGIVYCDARIEGRRLRWFGSVRPGGAACRWDIAENAAGKMIKGSISVNENGGPTVTRRFSERVISVGAHLSIEGGISTAPSQPRAGQKFYYRMGIAVRRGSSHKRIARGEVVCRATIGGRLLPEFQEEVKKNSGIRCGWNIPSGTAGQTMIGLIVVQAEGGTLTHRFTRRVR
jgi:hypothetical protein